ncbi:unnamed protein product [Tuber aestivum]|uniref:Efficient mitochondria targeting-associated protein 19 n=1 Tax=Tuber aestivum TaxID=59557 RepID=A0A292Q4N5_9PEZI|nr:unnamed protein product [Tuber aestivum]
MGYSTVDKLYLAFFAMFIPAMAFVDLIPIWPRAIVPAPLWALHEFYLDNFNDQLVIKFPTWFSVFIFFEACYNLPVAIWIFLGIRRGDSSSWVHMCMFGALCTLSTVVCIAEIRQDPDITALEQKMLMLCYVPFAIIFPTMAVHNMIRIQDRLALADRAAIGKKGN